MRKLIKVVLLGASALCGRALVAQEMPAFHRGEWAAEFTGGDAYSVGVMRFFSPQSALVMNFNGNIQSQNTDAPDGVPSTSWSQQNVGVGLGVRRLRGIAPRVVAFSEGGASLAYMHSRQEQSDVFGNQTRTTSRGWTYGAYGMLGGQYFLASHLALGAGVTLNVSRTSSKVGGDGPRYRTHGFNIYTALQPIRLTLYF